MVACFGLHDGCQLPRVPLDRLIECRARLDVVMLLRLGALTEGVETKLQVGKTPYRLATHTPNLLVDGNHVPVVWTDWALPWFECPRCRRRCRHIFLDELACRKCLRLDYASRHLRRQTPGVGRVERLRRKLGGCDTRPFAPLPADRGVSLREAATRQKASTTSAFWHECCRKVTFHVRDMCNFK